METLDGAPNANKPRDNENKIKKPKEQVWQAEKKTNKFTPHPMWAAVFFSVSAFLVSVFLEFSGACVCAG